MLSTSYLTSTPRTTRPRRSTLADATAPERIWPGAMRLAGNRHGQAVVRIVAHAE
jgi:hypothetical protein